MKVIKQIIFGLSLMATQMSPTQAETITIGKGSGVVWEGLAFNATLSGPMVSSALYTHYGLLSISDTRDICQNRSRLQNIGGFLALPLGETGVGLIPRATGSASYVRYNGSRESLSGTIGLPETKGKSSSGEDLYSDSNQEWCLPPTTTYNLNFYDKSATRTATISGTWVIVANGSQQNAEISVPTMYFASYSAVADGDRRVSILPSNITLRISSLECTVNTPTTINFNSVARNTQNGAQLALLSMPLNVSCGQPTDRISANVNLQFRAFSGLYGSAASRLSLTQGGGYITGEINNNVTGSGACNATTGLAFDNRVVKLGRIEATESSKTFNNQVTWRLCSGGSNLPTGKVDAAAEMLVTFN